MDALNEVHTCFASTRTCARAHAIPPPATISSACMRTQATEYDGEWSWSKMHGQGCFKFSNGDVYRGTFKDNQRHGQGTCRAVNGDVYQGEWRFGLQHGRGRWETKDGMIYDGEWKVNKLSPCSLACPF